jgi:spore coat protein H
MRKLFLVGIASFLLSVVVFGQTAQQTGDKNIFGHTKLHKISLTLTRAEWDVMQTSSLRGGVTGEGGTDVKQPDGRIIHIGSGFRGGYPWVHADLRLEGGPESVLIKDVGLRYKGNLSFSSSSAANPLRANLKMKTDMFGGKDDWNGIETFNFHAGVLDSSLAREALGFSLFRAAGVPAPRTSYVEIGFNVPGVYTNTNAGMYTLIENVNKQMLKNALPPGTGLLFKPEGLRGGVSSQGDTWDSHARVFRPDRDATQQEKDRLLAFTKLVSQPDTALFRAQIGNHMDVEQFLRFLAVNAFMMNWDGYLTGNHNFYLYLDPKDDKFRFIPWDLDLSMGSRIGGNQAAGNMLRPSTQPLIQKLLDDPAVSERYRAILKEFTGTIFSRASIEKTLEELETVNARRDAGIRGFIDSRIQAMQALLPELSK